MTPGREDDWVVVNDHPCGVPSESVSVNDVPTAETSAVMLSPGDTGLGIGFTGPGYISHHAKYVAPPEQSESVPICSTVLEFFK